MKDMTAFQRDILCIIAGMDELYGLTIKQKLEEYYNTNIVINGDEGR